MMIKHKTENNMSSSGLTRRSRNKDIHSTGFPVKRGMTKDLESGRSMVEMLGVLAVVGVLSVGSIAGYTYAMNKYYANELLAGASERAVLVAAQIASGRTPNLNEFANHTVPNGTFGAVEEFEDGGFGIKVSKVKDAVCQNVLKAVDGTEVFIAKDDNAEVLNEMSESDCSGDNNNFWFVYADDMGAIDSIFDPETPTDEEKKEYICTAGGVFKKIDNESYELVTHCDPCSYASTYYSDEEAVSAMCIPVLDSPGSYYCSGNVVVGPDVSSYCTDACEGDGYFENLDEAVEELCLYSYYCSNSGAELWRSGANLITSCNCKYPDFSYFSYLNFKNDAEAIAAMCTVSNTCSSEGCVTSGFYYCDENNLLGQKGNGNFYSWCDCKAGIAKFEGQNFDSDEAAIAAMCE